MNNLLRHNVVPWVNVKDVDEYARRKPLSACDAALLPSLQVLRSLCYLPRLVAHVDLREWIPKNLGWVFHIALTADLTQFSNALSPIVTRIDSGTGRGRDCPGLPSSWISHLLF